MLKELEMGKRYTWDEVVEAYPGMWVRMTDCTLIQDVILIDGVLVGVYTDDESEEVELKMWDEESSDELRRTTIGINTGIIECLNAEMEVRDEP